MPSEGSLFDVPPAAIGRFRVLHQVGAGTSGPVFRGTHPETGAALAIKLFTLALEPERVSAVTADLERVIERLTPADGLCDVIDAGVHGSAPYLVTAFAPGDSLDVALKQFGPAAMMDLIPRLGTIAAALDAAAARDVLHGAMHPRDVLVSESTTLLTGVGAWPILTRHGERLPIRRPYRAPELSDSAVTAAGDRFALAAMAYEWMTGRRAPSAFVARDMAPLAGVDTAELGRVFARALHADPGERYESSEAFVAELAQVDVEEDEAVFVPEPPKIAASTRRRRPPEAKPMDRLPLEAFPPRADDVAEPADEGADDEGGLQARPEEVASAEHLGQDEPVATQSGEPFTEAAAASEVTLFPSENLPPVSHVPDAPVAHEPDRFPAAPSPHSAFREIHYEPPIAPQRASSSRWRTVAGLLLGAIIGIGAGYFAWGRDPGLLTGGTQDSAPTVPQSAQPPDQIAPEPSAVPATASPAPTEPAPPPPVPDKPTSAAPAAAPALDSGNLLVRSTPSGATVFVDDRRRGVTPLTLQNVELGTRRVHIVRDGFSAEDRQVTLTRSRPSRSVDVRLTRAAPATRPAPAATPPSSGPAARTGSLVIESRPTGATIILNGRTIGTTPMTIDDLEPGTYTVQLQLATFRPITTTVRVVAGARARAAASLVSAQEPE